MNTPDTTQMMTRSEVAALLRCSLGTLDSRINDGTLPAVKLGRKVLISRGDVAAMLAARVKVAARARGGGSS